MKKMIRVLIVMALFIAASKVEAQPGCCFADAGANKTICPSGTVTIGGTTAGTDTCGACNLFQYQWSPEAGLSDATVSNPVASPSQTTVYTLLVYTRNGPDKDHFCCVAMDTVTVTVSGNCNVMPKENQSWLDEMVLCLAVRDKDILRREESF